MVGSNGKSMFNCLRMCQIVFQSVVLFHCAFPPAIYQESDFSTSLPTIFIASFFIVVVLVGVESCLILNYNSLIAKDVEHFFMCLLVIYVSSQKCLSISVAYFFNWILYFGMSNFLSSL